MSHSTRFSNELNDKDIQIKISIPLDNNDLKVYKFTADVD